MSRPLVAADLARLVFVSQVQVHPTLSEAVCVKKTVATPGTYRSNLVRIGAGFEPTPLTEGDFSDGSPRWSPDGALVAFLSNRDKPGTQIYVVSAADRALRKVTTLPEGSIKDLSWMPDGSGFICLFRAKDPSRTENAGTARKDAKASEPPLEVTRWPWREDGDGVFNNERYLVVRVDLASGEANTILDCADTGEYSYAIHPDSRSLAVAYQTGESQYLEPSTNSLFLVDLATGDQKEIPTEFGELGALCFSPCGRYLAGVQSTRPQDRKWGPRKQHVWVHDVSTGASKVIAPEMDDFIDAHCIGDARDPGEMQLFWGPKEDGVWFQFGQRGHQRVAWLGFDATAPTWVGPDTRGEIHIGNISADGTRLGIWVTTPTAPAEAGLFSLVEGALVYQTEFNREFLAEVDVVEPEEVWLVSPDQSQFQAWTLTPRGDGPFPAAIEVHGGPMAMYTDAFFFEMQLLCASGFVVGFSNPRGSTGDGEEFCRSIMGNWGDKDWMDVKTLTAYVRSLPSVVDDRVSILGGSYGGFMVNWAISHTDTYHRAITDRCVSNLLSKWGNSDYMFIPDASWPGRAFGDYKQLWECSPIKHFASVVTPTLIIHSEGDLRCHIEQGEQVFTALKILGVETKMIRYPLSTSHGMSRGGPPDLRIHRLEAIVDWLSRE